MLKASSSADLKARLGDYSTVGWPKYDVVKHGAMETPYLKPFLRHSLNVFASVM
jgi:hypothetical protein